MDPSIKNNAKSNQRYHQSTRVLHDDGVYQPILNR